MDKGMQKISLMVPTLSILLDIRHAFATGIVSADNNNQTQLQDAKQQWSNQNLSDALTYELRVGKWSSISMGIQKGKFSYS